MPSVQVVTSSIYKKLTGGIVRVSRTVEFPVSNVAPKSSVVAARACGLTTKPCTKLSTYLLFVASVAIIGSSKTLIVVSTRSNSNSRYVLLIASNPSIGSSIPETLWKDISTTLLEPGSNVMLAFAVNVPSNNSTPPASNVVSPTILFEDSPRVKAVVPSVISLVEITLLE